MPESLDNTLTEYSSEGMEENSSIPSPEDESEISSEDLSEISSEDESEISSEDESELSSEDLSETTSEVYIDYSDTLQTISTGIDTINNRLELSFTLGYVAIALFVTIILFRIFNWFWKDL